jgi:hypothetical protein
MGRSGLYRTATRAAYAVATMTDTAVADPIRIPPWLREGAERAWREAPPLARLFVGLTLFDVLVRLLRLVEPWIYFDQGVLAFIGSFAPRDLLILLPAILVLRRPDAARITPLVVAGAIAMALLQLLARPIALVVTDGLNDDTLVNLYDLAAAAIQAAAWIAIAIGLRRLSAGKPTPFTTGLANLAAIGIVVQLGLQTAATLWPRPVDLLDVQADPVRVGVNVLASFEILGWAFLLRQVVRGLDDGRRPMRALVAGSTAALLASFVGIVPAIVQLISMIQLSWVVDGFASPVYLLLVELSGGWATSLLVVAFALGLAEPPVLMAAPAATPAEP